MYTFLKAVLLAVLFLVVMGATTFVINLFFAYINYMWGRKVEMFLRCVIGLSLLIMFAYSLIKK